MTRGSIRSLLGALVAIVTLALYGSPLATRADNAHRPGPRTKPSPSAHPAPATSPTAAPVAAPSPSAAAAEPAASGQSKLSQAISALGKAQTLLEFFFMETGSYPDTVEDMLALYNQGTKTSETPVSVPTDPATGKKLIYTPNADHDAYTVRVPDASAYNLGSLEVHQLDWGWMASIAQDARKKRMMVRCGQYQELLAGVINQYNKDNRNKFPEKLDKLMPKYLTKIPTCPVTGKPYVYTFNERGYEVGCPNPAAHSLEIFRFSSTEGPKRYP